MNLPNKLTVARIVMVPIYMLLMLVEFPFHITAALAVFGLAALTDYFDGKIARSRNLITNLGKFLDPIADKMLTTAAFLLFLHLGCLDVWAVMLVLTREFMVTSVRLMAAKDGTVVAASFAGKLKTVMQFVSIIAMMLSLEWQNICAAYLPDMSALGVNFPVYISWGLIWVSVVATVISGFQYFWQFRHYFTESK